MMSMWMSLRTTTWRSTAPVPSYTMLPKMAPVSVDDTCTLAGFRFQAAECYDLAVHTAAENGACSCGRRLMKNGIHLIKGLLCMTAAVASYTLLPKSYPSPWRTPISDKDAV